MKKVLAIAGSDSGGGAGIQADIKAITAIGCFATTAITAITAQNTLGVQGVYPIASDIIEAQIKSVMEDIRPEVVKIGVLCSVEMVDTVAKMLLLYRGYIKYIVLDPVITASTGAIFLNSETINAIKTQLFPLVDIITPNTDELGALVRMSVRNIDDVINAGQQIKATGLPFVLVTGGHLSGNIIRDVLFVDKKTHILESPRINTRNTHGTGCTVSSAIAAYLALGYKMDKAVKMARAYIYKALINSDHIIGNGVVGPVGSHYISDKIRYLLFKK